MRRRRRGFALITAIGVLAILGLIVAALGKSIDDGRRLSSLWRERADERLATTCAVSLARTNTSSAVPAIAEGTWGGIPITVSVVPLNVDSPVYRHPALSHRAGDQLATVRIGEATHTLLLRGDSHHRLPSDLTPPEEATP